LIGTGLLKLLLNHPAARLIEGKPFHLFDDVNVFEAEPSRKRRWQDFFTTATGAPGRLIRRFSTVLHVILLRK